MGGRPEWLDNLKQSLNHSTTFLTQSREKTEKVVEEEKLFKEKELEQLEKKIAEVEKWRDEKLAAQADTPLTDAQAYSFHDQFEDWRSGKRGSVLDQKG